MGRALTEEQLLVWKSRISRQRKSGLSIAEFCRQESVSVASFSYWKRKLPGVAKPASRKVKAKAVTSDGSAEGPATFFRVPLPEPPGVGWIEIVAADGTQIRVPHQSLDALELALAAITGRSARL
jgi:hypothetical protein